MTTEKFKSIKQQTFPASGCFVLNTYTPSNVTALNPAIDVMTDLRKTSSASISPEASIERAHQMMLQRGVRMLLATADDYSIAGLITAADILGEKPVQIAQSQGVKRGELKVKDIMVSNAKIQVMNMVDVANSQVGNVVTTLKEANRAHALVVDETNGKLSLVGVFSANQIARQMGVQIQTHEMARTFAEIEAVIAGV